MTTEPGSLPADLKLGFCRYCQRPRTKAELRPTKTAKGTKITRCIECIERTLPSRKVERTRAR